MVWQFSKNHFKICGGMPKYHNLLFFNPYTILTTNKTNEL